MVCGHSNENWISGNDRRHVQKPNKRSQINTVSLFPVSLYSMSETRFRQFLNTWLLCIQWIDSNFETNLENRISEPVLYL